MWSKRLKIRLLL